VSAAITSPQLIKTEIISRAHELGFAECRIAAAQPAAHREVYEQWIAEGKYGDMAWMARNLERRTDPRIVVLGARSIIVLALNYYQGHRPSRDPSYRIARYAWNDDYHDLIEKRLDELSALLTEHGGTQRRYVDTGPVLERDFATESGLGWNGKSTMQLSRQLGTWFFICEIITTLELPIDTPARDMCGKCTRCIDACPTGAITAPHRLDARKCISYLTIEHKGSIPIEYRRAIGDHLYGCDDCLDACPWNRFAQASNEAAFQARESVFSKKLTDFLALTDEEFRALFARSPIKRIKRPAFLRNVCVVLGNVGTADDIPALEDAAADPHPLIAEHAQWALDEIRMRVQSHDGAAG
jgi:epoxyqueuosine reductase